MKSLQEELSNSLTSLKADMQNVKSQMQNIRPGIDSTAEPSSSEKNPSMSRSRGIASQKPDVNRQQNLILFGLSEKHSLIESKCIIDEFLVNKPVVIKDLVRIGRSKKGEGASGDVQRPHPILVKVDSVWDHRLLLASKSKLKQFRVDRLFLREDLPPEVRHRRFSPRSDSGPSSFPSTSPN